MTMLVAGYLYSYSKCTALYYDVLLFTLHAYLDEWFSEAFRQQLSSPAHR